MKSSQALAKRRGASALIIFERMKKKNRVRFTRQVADSIFLKLFLK
jgi:hypothetical protein